MKKNLGFQTLMLLILACVACQRQADLALLETGDTLFEKQAQMTINAMIEGEEGTRTSLGGGSSLYYPLWSENDQIAVYSGAGSPAMYTLQSGAGSREATFGGDQLTGSMVGLYPYSAASDGDFSNHVLTLVLPSEQQYVQGSFGAGAYPMIAVSSLSSDLTFKNLCAILRVSLTGSDPVKSIRFHAHAENRFVSGKATVRTDYETVPELIMSSGGSPDVTLQCDNVNLDPETPTEFFLVIPPGTYTGGFDLVISSATGEMSRSTDADITFERSQYRSVPAFTFVPEAKPIPTPNAIDLGLSVKWASFNLGASKPEEYGDYYAWGETEPYYSSLIPLTWKSDKSGGYTWASYRFNPSGDGKSFNKYTGSDYSVLQKEDDAATVHLGDRWRMATIDEWLELRNTNNCDWVWQENYNNSGKNGYLVTSKKSGYTDKSIFLPAAGHISETSYYTDDWGEYWSSTLKTDSGNGVYAYNPYFSPTFVDWSGTDRNSGCSIRPVFNDDATVDANRCLYYTSSTGNKVDPSYASYGISDDEAFGGARIISNVYENGKGMIVFDREVTELVNSFQGILELTTISYPESVTKISSYAFTNCQNLTGDFWIPRSQEIIYKFTFSGCLKLTTITIPDSVKEIHRSAFSACRSLAEITVPESVSKIEAYAFYQCSGLTRITVLAKTPPELGTDVFSGSTCPIFVPVGALEAYKTAEKWSVYADRIQAIQDSSFAVPETVDLGLSVKWANMNIGASRPEEFGDYYAWGETEPYYSSLDPLVWKPGKEDGYIWTSYKWFTYEGLTKYCTDPANGKDGFTDGKIVLDPEDDAAHVHLGSKWRMPTKKEMDELIDRCTWTWSRINGVSGYMVTGINGNQIFLPSAGSWSFTDYYVEDNGALWTSSLKEDDPKNLGAIGIAFDPSSIEYSYHYGRYCGYPIRAVYNDN